MTRKDKQLSKTLKPQQKANREYDPTPPGAVQLATLATASGGQEQLVLIQPARESFERFVAGRLAEPGVADKLLTLAAA